MSLPKHAVAVRLAVPLLLSAALAGCGDHTPTEAVISEAGSAAVTATPGTVVARDLGVLPGETQSEATYIDEHGLVYGRSGNRFFRWSEANGMQEVSGPVPAPPVEGRWPIPAGAPAASVAANVWGEVTGGGPPVFRWSQREGLRLISLDLFQCCGIRGRAINNWGHVVSGINDAGDWNYWFWSPVQGTTFIPVQETSERLVFGEDDVLYTHESLSDYFPVFRGRATSPHFPGGERGGSVSLLPPADAPVQQAYGPNDFTCTHYDRGPSGVVVNSTSNRFQAVGYAWLPCSTYKHAVLWDLRSLERPRPEVLGAAASPGRLGVPSTVPYTFNARGSTGPWTVTVDWGDQTTTTDTAGVPGVQHTQQHVYTSPQAYYLARIYVKDALGAWTVTQTQISAIRPNAAPQVELEPFVSARDGVPVGQEFIVRAWFTDDGPDDGPWTFAFDWGTSTHATGIDNRLGSISETRFHAEPIDLHFRYDVPGTYTFRFSVTDRFGATSRTAETTVRVVAP